MEEQELQQNQEQGKKVLDDNVHAILAHSYMSYLFAFLLGLFFHFFFPIKVYSHEIISYVGFAFLVISTLLIIWAQKTSRKLDVENISKDSFRHGPYCYSRMPTHWGLLFLLIGFALIINSFFTFLFTVISFISGKLSFVKKEEEALLKKYGRHYLEYKKIVKF